MVKLHSAVLASTIAAIAAVGVAGSSVFLVDSPSEAVSAAAKKQDRLHASVKCQVAELSGAQVCLTPEYTTVETRVRGENLSVLTKVPTDEVF